MYTPQQDAARDEWLVVTCLNCETPEHKLRVKRESLQRDAGRSAVPDALTSWGLRVVLQGVCTQGKAVV